jgi:alpha-glucosidase
MQQYRDIGSARFAGRDDADFVFVADQATVRITVLTAGIARVWVQRQNEPPPRSWAVWQQNWSKMQVSREESRDRLTLKTARMGIEVQLSPLRLTFRDGQGFVLSQDAPEQGLGIPVDPQAGGGCCVKILAADEHCFGCGERTGKLDKRGQHIVYWNVDPPIGHSDHTEEMYVSIPFVLGLRQGRAYGLFLDSPFRSSFDLGAGQPARMILETAGGPFVYYFCAGPTPREVLAQYTSLTGRMPLPPLWALGYHQCRWGYRTADRLRELAAEFRRRQIPCDALWLDIDYMDGYRVFTWNAERFPDPPALLAELRTQGFRVVTIIDPGVKVDDDYVVYRDGRDHDYFCRLPNGEIATGNVWPGLCAFPDFARADVREWWGRLHASLLDAGVAGIWNDMNEPSLSAVPLGTTSDNKRAELHGRTLPLDTIHHIETPDGPVATHAEIHNVYGMLMTRATREGLERLRPNERPFVLSRSGFAGIQRYSAIWTGDNSSLWEHIKLAIIMCGNLSLSGIPMVGADIGGFWGTADGELLARFMQLGALLPFCRNHTVLNAPDQEPWAFGPQYEAICREAITLRYRLLPYLYTLYYQSASTGAPVMRPLCYDFPGDAQACAVEDQFMVGDALLVAPVYTKGATSRMVYFPRGTWAHLLSGRRYKGPSLVEVPAPLEEIPLFVRCGAVLPLAPAMPYTGAQPVSVLKLLCFSVGPGHDGHTWEVHSGVGSTLLLYEDDGISLDYRRGAYRLTPINCAWETGRVVIGLGEPEGSYQPPRTAYLLELHMPSPYRPLAVRFDHADLSRVEQADEQSTAACWSAHETAPETVVSIFVPDPGHAALIEIEV